MFKILRCRACIFWCTQILFRTSFWAWTDMLSGSLCSYRLLGVKLLLRTLFWEWRNCLLIVFKNYTTRYIRHLFTRIQSKQLGPISHFCDLCFESSLSNQLIESVFSRCFVFKWYNKELQTPNCEIQSITKIIYVPFYCFCDLRFE